MLRTENSIYTFADLVLDPVQRQLSKAGRPVAMNAKCLDLLIYLIENRGRVIDKEELLENVWPGQFVEENNLTVQISALRKALGQTKGSENFVVTVPGRGYSFVRDVTSAENVPAAAITERVRDMAPPLDDSGALIGRTAELDEIKRIFTGGESRLVTLTGAGGSGKTTLAKAAAEMLSDQFAGRIYISELADVLAADQFAASLAADLGAAAATAESPLRQAAEFLKGERSLLVLDNFEQIISAKRDVEELLRQCPALNIILTSRSALRIPGELELNVRPLAIPPNDLRIPAADLVRYPAVRLFLVRTRSVRPQLKIDDATIGAAAEICRRLDGLPLAIELTAARMKLLSAEGILERLTDSLKLLSGGTGLPERQQTMRAAVQWSYDLLSEVEKRIFRRLSIFSGGFTVDAAEEVAGDQDAYVLDTVTSLVEQGLLTMKELDDGSVRLRMLEVVREFAQECARAEHEAALPARHAAFFLRLAERAEPGLVGDNCDEWIRILDLDHENLRSAIRWAIEGEPETAARICGALRYFWANQCYYASSLELMRSALAHFSGDHSIRFKLMNGIGQMTRNQGDYEAARQIYQDSLDEASDIGDLRQSAIALHGLAAIATRQHDFEAAREYNNEELRLCRVIGDEAGIATALASLADVALAENKTNVARPLIEESMQIARRLGKKQLLMTNLLNCGIADFADEQWDAAGKCFSESLEIAQKLGNTTFASCAIDGLGALAAEAGQYDRGAFMAGAAHELRSSVGYQIEPAERAFSEAYVKKLQSALGDAAFAEAFERGRTLTLSETVGLLPRKPESAASPHSAHIIIESRSYSRIVVEEEIDEPDARDPQAK